jgi:hypothetical protein
LQLVALAQTRNPAHGATDPSAHVLSTPEQWPAETSVALTQPLDPHGALVGWIVQVPTLPAMPHDSHSAPHGLSQQMPDTQLPLVHSTFATHVSPFVFVETHLPASEQ